MAGSFTFSGSEFHSVTQSASATFTAHSSGSINNGFLALDSWSFTRSGSYTVTWDDTSASSGHIGGVGSISESNSMSLSAMGSAGSRNETASVNAAGTQTLTLDFSQYSTEGGTTTGREYAHRHGTFAHGSFNLSSTVYDATATDEYSLYEETETTSRHQKNSTATTANSSGGAGAGYQGNGEANESHSAVSAHSSTADSSASSTLDRSREREVHVYEAGALANGILSLSSALYHRSGDSDEALEAGSLTTTVSMDSTTSMTMGANAQSYFFGNGSQTLSGTLTLAVVETSQNNQTAESTACYVYYHAGTFDGARFNFSSYSFHEGEASHETEHSVVVKSSDAAGTFSTTTSGQFTLGGFFSLGSFSGVSDSGTTTLDSASTVTADRSSSSTYTLDQVGYASAGHYTLTAHVRNSTSLETIDIVATGNQTTTVQGSGATYGSYSGGGNRTSADEFHLRKRATDHQAGSWSPTGGFNLSSVLYVQSSSATATHDAADTTSITGGRTANAYEHDHSFRYDHHSPYKAGTYSGGSFAFSSFALHDTALGSQVATKKETKPDWNFSSTDSEYVNETLHAEAVYHGGSYSFSTYAHDKTGLTAN